MHCRPAAWDLLAARVAHARGCLREAVALGRPAEAAVAVPLQPPTVRVVLPQVAHVAADAAFQLVAVLQVVVRRRALAVRMAYLALEVRVLVHAGAVERARTLVVDAVEAAVAPQGVLVLPPVH